MVPLLRQVVVGPPGLAPPASSAVGPPVVLGLTVILKLGVGDAQRRGTPVLVATGPKTDIGMNIPDESKYVPILLC